MPAVRATRPITTVVLVGAITVFATACSSNSSSTTAASSSTVHQASASTSTSTPSSALAAYQAMWKDVTEAINTDAYQASYLGDHLSGKALATITDNMATDKAQGIVAHGAPILHPVVTSALVSSAVISDCMDDRAWLEYYAATDKLVNDIPGGFRATTATVTDQGGTWKVTQISTGVDGTCHLSTPTD
jgi:hypothetical protein